jgi:cytochrome c556
MERHPRRTLSLSLAALLVVAALAAASRVEAADTRLKELMKKVGPTSTGDDARALAPLFEQAKALVPNDPELSGMRAVFDKGIAAANAGDLAAAKANCKTCHTQFREKYKTKYGSKAR